MSIIESKKPFIGLKPFTTVVFFPFWTFFDENSDKGGRGIVYKFYEARNVLGLHYERSL